MAEAPLHGCFDWTVVSYASRNSSRFRTTPKTSCPRRVPVLLLSIRGLLCEGPCWCAGGNDSPMGRLVLVSGSGTKRPRRTSPERRAPGSYRSSTGFISAAPGSSRMSCITTGWSFGSLPDSSDSPQLPAEMMRASPAPPASRPRHAHA